MVFICGCCVCACVVFYLLSFSELYSDYGGMYCFEVGVQGLC